MGARPLSCQDRLPDELRGRPEIEEVLDVFGALFASTRHHSLPPYVEIRRFIPDACFDFAQGHVPAWEFPDDTPSGTIYLYREIYENELAEIQLPSALGSALVSALYSPTTVQEIESIIPRRMRGYSEWICNDLTIIAEKRAACGLRPSLIEDMFHCYRAGFFPYGWDGTYPSAVRLLVFAGDPEGEDSVSKE
jgi:hypothetical protein